MAIQEQLLRSLAQADAADRRRFRWVREGTSDCKAAPFTRSRQSRPGPLWGQEAGPGWNAAAARKLARRSPKTGQQGSLRPISAELAALNHLGPGGRPYLPGSVARMLV